MVDTVILRVHNLTKHENLIKYLEKVDSGKKRITRAVDENFDATREIYLKNYYRDLATGRSFDTGYDGFLRSSHYDIRFYVFYQRDYMEFNISLPKYWYGTNIFQIIDHHFDPKNLDFRNNEFWNVKQLGFKRFALVLNHFLGSSLAEMCDKADTEIARIDFCYNLIFNTKDDALHYLSEIKKIERPRFAKTAVKITNYAHGLYFPSENFTFKVYHKGSEFLKHSARRYKKEFGEERMKNVQAAADRMLRFEIEMRKPFLTSVFIRRLKEENPKVYKSIKFARQFAKAGYIVENEKRYNFDGLVGVGVSGSIEKMNNTQMQMLKAGQNLITKRISFFLDSSKNSLVDLDYSDYKSYQFKELFGYFQFEACIYSFKQYFTHFQLGSMDKVNAINWFITAKNEADFKNMIAREAGLTSYRIGIDFRKAKQVYELLLDNSWDEIKNKQLFSERTLRRYKQFFKERFGLLQHNNSQNFQINFTYGNYLDAVVPFYAKTVPKLHFPL